MTVDVADVAVLLGRDLTSAEEARAIRLIDLAEAKVEEALPGFSFAAGSETVTVDWHDADVIWTPRYPVTALTALSFDGTPVPANYLKWDAKGKVEILGLGSVWVVNGPWWGWSTLTLTYDYGLTPPPDAMVELVAGMVAGVLRQQGSNPDLIQAETVGAYSVTYQRDAGGQGMVVPPVPVRWKRNAVASVPFSRVR